MNLTAVIILFVCLAVCFIIRMPISFSMLISCIVYYLCTMPQALGIVANTINTKMFSNYTMLAAPLFVFMANVLNEGEVTDKIFAFCNGLLGRMKGGTAQVNVFISLVFSGMTGSAVADASGIGLMEIEQMKKEGYDAPFACAITAASATIGPIFPPSIPMIIYGMLSGASVSKLFLGGMVPGILLAILLMIYCFFISKKRNYPAGVKMSLRQFGKATLVAAPALFTVILLLGGIYSGVCTPTEIMAAMKHGVKLVKFFPANVYGGLNAMKNLAAPFVGIKFLPTGGVNSGNIKEYIDAPFIHAVGGSWVCPKAEIQAGNYEKITELCRDARKAALEG